MGLLCVLICGLSVNGRAKPSWKSTPKTVWDPGIQIGCPKGKGRFRALNMPFQFHSLEPIMIVLAGSREWAQARVRGCSLFCLLSESWGREYVLFLYVNKTQNESSLRAPLRSHCYSWHSLALLLTTRFPHWCFPGALQGPFPMLESCS